MRSNTSNAGNAPNPLGKLLNLLNERFKIRNFGIEDKESGNSSTWLFDTFNISKLIKFARPGGTTKIDLIIFINNLLKFLRDMYTFNFVVT